METGLGGASLLPRSDSGRSAKPSFRNDGRHAPEDGLGGTKSVFGGTAWLNERTVAENTGREGRSFPTPACAADLARSAPGAGYTW